MGGKNINFQNVLNLKLCIIYGIKFQFLEVLRMNICKILFPLHQPLIKSRSSIFQLLFGPLEKEVLADIMICPESSNLTIAGQLLRPSLQKYQSTSKLKPIILTWIMFIYVFFFSTSTWYLKIQVLSYYVTMISGRGSSWPLRTA